MEAKDLRGVASSGRISVCILIFGSLGKSAKASFASICREFPGERFCISADEAGKSWILENTPQEKLASLCFHNPSNSAVQLLGLGSSPNYSYSQFGKERFIKLTTFKWQLLRDSLKMHSDLSGVLFTDLDVLWFRNPFLLELREPPIKILAQDDTPNGGKSLHVCSGIMYFPNTKYSIKLLDNLFNTQFHLNKSGNLTPDEPILNNWIKDMGQSQNKLAVFDPHKFIIGHRFFHFMLRKKTLRHQAVCFHLNYVVGELRKHRRAKALVGREEKSLTWFFYFVIELFLVGISRFKLR